MIIVLKKNISDSELDRIERFVRGYESQVKFWEDNGKKFIGIVDQDISVPQVELRAFAGVEKIIPLTKPYKKVSAEIPETPININGKTISKDNFNVIAGPCTIQSYQELHDIVFRLKDLGIKFFRGGAYKLRTSPYSFQGLGTKGLSYIKKVSEESGLVSVSEVICSEDIPIVSEHVDILVVGTRNMYNYRLLQNLGKINNPIILKRGMSATLEEWLLAAEHIAESGNENIILCERGIRTFERFTRNTLDISAVPAVKLLSNLPIIVDPSHSTGLREMIKSVSWAAMAAGADGLLLETHTTPNDAICDSRQTIDFDILKEILEKQEIVKLLWGKQHDNYRGEV